MMQEYVNPHCNTYMDKLFKQLKRNGIGCRVGPLYAGAFGYADDVALIAPSLHSLTLYDPGGGGL